MKKINFFVCWAIIAMTQITNAAQPGPLIATLITGTVPKMNGDDSDAAWASDSEQPINVILINIATGFGVDGNGVLDATF